MPQLILSISNFKHPIKNVLSFQISAAAMARVARYTGAEGYDTNETRLLTLLPPPSTAHALRAVLCAVLHANVDTHFTLL